MTMTREQEKLQVAIETCEKTMAKVDEIKAVVAKFDGKVYNCRFDKALTAAGCFVSHSPYENSILIYRGNGFRRYSSNELLFKFCWSRNNKRINSEDVNNNISLQAAFLRERIAKYKKEIATGEEFVADLNRALKEIAKKIKCMDPSPEFIDAYKYRINKYYGHGVFRIL